VHIDGDRAEAGRWRMRQDYGVYVASINDARLFKRLGAD